jgi:hypothetical protein
MYNALQSIQAFEAGTGQRKERERETAMKGIGNALAGGDYKGASASLFGMGNIEAGFQAAEYGKGLEDAEAEKRRVGLIGLGMKYLQLPEQQRLQSRDQIVQEMAQFGVQMDPQQALGMDLSDRGIKGTLATLQDPETLQKQFQAMMAPTEYGFQNVSGVGLVRTDPRKGTAETAMAAVPEIDLPEGMRMGQNGEPEYIPGYIETQERLRRAGATAVNVNAASEKGETEFQKGLGSQAATNVQTVLEQGRAAGASIGNLDTMESLLDQIDYTGFGGDTLLQVQRAGAMLGIEIPDLPAKEAAKRLSSQMALSLKSDLPGPMSNADREFLLSIPPNLNSTAAGNDAILFILRKREERKQDMMQSLLQADVKSMEEYRAWEKRYLQETPPMFTPATQSSLLRALGSAGADTPQ